MNRRTLFKLLSLYGLSHIVNLEASDIENKKIVIVGAGTGGLLCLALFKQLVPKLDITVISPNETHIYQAGQTFIAAGLMKEDEIRRETKEFLEGTLWIKQKVKSFKPDDNILICADGRKVDYDYLIVSMGLAYDYEKIRGLKQSDLGSNGIASVYLNNVDDGSIKGASDTKKWFLEIRKSAESKKIKVVFTHPHGAIKCGGVSSSLIYLLRDFLKGNSPEGGKDVSKNVEILFAKPGTKIFGVNEYNEVLTEQAQEQDVEMKFNHVLESINTQTKTASFEHKYKLKGAYDEDFDEWEIISKEEQVEIHYDFIHIVPPMQGVKALRESDLAKKSGLQVGYCKVDRNTLQHKHFKNVFSVGDSAAVPLGKTAAAAAKQANVTVNNIINLMKKEDLLNFDGYSACPIKLSYQKVLFAEFNYEGYTQDKIQNPKLPSKELFDYDLHALPNLYWKAFN